MAVNTEDKENVPRSNHQVLKNHLNSDKIIPPSSSSNVLNLSNSAHSGPQTHKLHYSRLSPITPSPPPLPVADTELSHGYDNESFAEQKEHSLNSGHFSYAAARCHSDTAAPIGSVLAHGRVNDDRAPSVSAVSPGVSDTEAPVSTRYTETREDVRVVEEEEMKCGSSVLGKRKSSERDSHSSDDGYCTCGSCDSTPSGSAVATTTNCVCQSRVKRKEEECSSTREKPFSSEEPTCVSQATSGCGDVFERGDSLDNRVNSFHGTQVRTCGNSDMNVNDILEEFDRIFQSPEAVAVETTEEKHLSTTDSPQPPPSSPILVSDYRGVQRPPSTLQSGVRSDPQDGHQVTSSAVEEKPVIDLSIGLEEIAKREDEELKRAMEESLKQQVISHNVSE